MSDLSTGHVPVVRIRELLIVKLGIEDGHFGTDHPELICLTRMWDDSDRIWKVLNGTGDARGQEWMEFNVADQLLCLLGLQLCWYEELEDIYYAVNLRTRPISRTTPKGERRCERDGCSAVFAPTMPWQRFCSQQCQRAQWRNEHSEGARTMKSRRYDQCPQGHDRSPENTQWILDKRSGKLKPRCRVCFNEHRRAVYAEKSKDPAFMAAKRERELAGYHARQARRAA